MSLLVYVEKKFDEIVLFVDYSLYLSINHV